jgi:hypothetical protein
MLESILRSIGEVIPGVLYYYDLQQQVRFLSGDCAALYMRLTGRVPQPGETIADFLPDPDLRAKVEEHRQRAAAGEPVTAEYTLRFGRPSKSGKSGTSLCGISMGRSSAFWRGGMM